MLTLSPFFHFAYPLHIVRVPSRYPLIHHGSRITLATFFFFVYIDFFGCIQLGEPM
ncbi:hypothetical protein BCR42DRAFT_424057 [Absidia repens]|uniref:Uncharacterized protein n=1 Tax=Absidia repens TaxID=90262 RepID=A0A1X2I682_9FUNG|nr:hypothetical protein BCR42DRAFT_424057 [Absidia repens]